MITYSYKAQTQDGQKIRGIVQGVDKFDAADRIRKTCPIILELKPEKKRGAGTAS